MKKVIRLQNRRPTVPRSGVLLVFQRQRDIRKLEQELKELKEELNREEDFLIELLEKGAVPEPGTPTFYVEKTFRKNIAWRQVFEEQLGSKAARKVHREWPDTEYKHLRSGKPTRKKRHTEVKVYS